MDNAAENFEHLQLSDSDGERVRKTSSQRVSPEGIHNDEEEEARESALRDELQHVRKINGVIEGLLDSLDRAKGNMQVGLMNGFVLNKY